MRKNWKKLLNILVIAMMLSASWTFVFAEDGIADDARPVPKDISSCVIMELEDVVFDGTQHKPVVTIYDGDALLQESVDYTLTYGDNFASGIGSVKIMGQGSYFGVIEKTFSIKKKELKIKGAQVSSTGKPKLSWSKTAGVEKFNLYYSTKKDGPYIHLITTSKTSYVHTKATCSKTYYYQMKAVDQFGQSDNFQPGNIVKLTCKLPVTKIKSATVLKTGKPKLSWTKIKGAEKYAVYRSTKKNGTYKHMLTTKKTSWTDTNAKAGVKYYYKVKAIDMDNRNADSSMSKICVRSCDLKQPVITIDLTSKAKPKLTWKKVPAAEKYQVFRAAKKDGTYKSIGQTKKLSYIDKNAKGGKIYYYRVRAIDADNSGANSAKSMKSSIYVVNLNKKLIALTFDDGPGPYTMSIVNMLKKHNAKATFFVLGQRVKAYPDELSAIYNGGNEIGNHSYSHPILSYESGAVTESQMRKTDKAIKKVIGIAPTIMRPPGGGINGTVKQKVGKPLIMWSVDTRDWEHRDTATTVNCVMREAGDGDIILMHDIHEPTKDAALKLIPKLKKKGFELVTVSQLAKFKGKKLKNGTVYYSF